MSELADQIKDAISGAIADDIAIELISDSCRITGKDVNSLSAQDLAEFVPSLEEVIKERAKDPKTLKKAIRNLEAIKVKSMLSSFSF